MRVRDLFHGGDYLNDELPPLLTSVGREAATESSLHEDGSAYRSRHALSEASLSTLTALEAYRAEHAPPATPDDKPPWGGPNESASELMEQIAAYNSALNDLIESGEQ